MQSVIISYIKYRTNYSQKLIAFTLILFVFNIARMERVVCLPSHPFPAKRVSKSLHMHKQFAWVAPWAMGAWEYFVPTQQFRSMFY